MNSNTTNPERSPRGPGASPISPTCSPRRRGSRRHAHVTPVLQSRSLDALAGAQLHFKCENFQRVRRLQVSRRLQCRLVA